MLYVHNILGQFSIYVHKSNITLLVVYTTLVYYDRSMYELIYTYE